MNDTSHIEGWTNAATRELLEAGIASARLDAELILTHTLKMSRTYIHAHGDEAITPRYQDILDTRLALRCERVPIAYIVGHKEFYGRNFNVTPSTLIPRPESETMIDLLKESLSQQRLPLTSTQQKLADVGTGSGCLGITAKLEFPELDVTLLDTSRHALTIADENSKRLGAELSSTKSNLLQSYPYQAEYVLANLPYVSEDQEVSPETHHEPSEALYAEDDGLALIFRLLEEAPSHVTDTGSILLEAEPRQHDRIIVKAATCGFKHHTTRGFIVQLKKA